MNTIPNLISHSAKTLAVSPMRTLLFACIISASIPAVADTEPWFTQALVGMEVGPTGAQFAGGDYVPEYASKFNGRDIVRRCVDANADYLVLWVRDGEFTFHHSKLLPSPPGLGERDVLREAVDEGHKVGLPIIAYCQLQYPAYELRNHPEWKMRQADGKPIDNLVCFNSSYGDRVEALLAEMMEYGIDGFHLDMVDQGFGPPTGCWCENCQKLFKAEHGRPMPKGVDWNDEDWHRFVRFRYATSDRFEKRLTDFIRNKDSSVTVDFNYHGNPPFSWEVGQRPVRHAGNGDFVTGEAGLWAFGALTASYNAAWYRAATPGNPFQVAVQRGVRMYHDQTTRPLNDMRWEMFTLLAHGAFVTMIDKTAYDGWLDPVAYDRIGALLEEARRKRAHFGHAPLRDVGIYFSAPTRDWIGRNQPSNYFQSVQGAHKACVYEHLGFGFVFEENLSLETLQEFPVISLSHAGILSDREIELLHRYVEQGGNLLITGHAGLYDSKGQPLKESRLSRLIGANATQRLESVDSWMRFQGLSSAQQPYRELTAGIPSDWPFLVRGPSVVYEPVTALPIGELLDSHRATLSEPGSYNKDWPLSARNVIGPAALVNPFGKGIVLTLAGSPDQSTAGEHHIVETRKLFANAVRLLHPQPRVRVIAPANVEAVVTDDPEERILRIHLIAYNPTPQTTPTKNRPYVLPGLIEDAPIFRARFEFRDHIHSAQALNPSTEVEIQETQVKVTVEDIHEVIQCRY